VRPQGRFGPWLLAVRPATLTAAVAPVIVGSATAARAGSFHLLPALSALCVALCVQIGTNLTNDAFDFLHGADPPSRRGPPRVTATGLLPADRVLRGAYVSFLLAGLAGLYVVALRGYLALLVGAACILAGWAYTAGPLRLGYRGLGEVLVFVFFGLVAVAGTDAVQTGAVRPEALAAAVPVGFVCTAILVVNNLRDVDTDRATGKRTLAVRLGPQAARVEYLLLIVGALAGPVGMRWAGWAGEWFWTPWLLLPWAVRLVRTVWTREDGPALNGALRSTAQFHFAYAVLLALAILA